MWGNNVIAVRITEKEFYEICNGGMPFFCISVIKP